MALDDAELQFNRGGIISAPTPFLLLYRPRHLSSSGTFPLLCALTTIGSFGSLSLSHHRGTASMGYLLTLAIVFTLLSALVVLPALIAWRARLREGSTNRGGMDGPL